MHNDIHEGALQLIAEHRVHLLSKARSLCDSEDEAEELVIRTIDQAIRKVDTFAGEGDILSWMMSILVNLHKHDHRSPVVRGTKAVDADELERCAGADWSTDEQILRNSDSEAIRRALSGLDPKYHQVVLMRYYDEFSLKQIANVMRLPIGTVSRRLHFAHRMLAGKLHNEFGRAKKPLAVLAAVLSLTFLSVAAVVATVPTLAPVRDVVAGFLGDESGTGCGTCILPVQVDEATSSEHGQDAGATWDACATSGGTGDCGTGVPPAWPETVSMPKKNTTTQEKSIMKFTKTLAGAVLSVATAAVAAFDAKADTISVPEGTTYRMDATMDYSSLTFEMCGGTLDLNGVTASVAGLTFSDAGTSTFTNSGETATLTYAGGFKAETATSKTLRAVHVAGGRHVFPSGEFSLASDTRKNPFAFEMSGGDTYISVERNRDGRFCNGGEVTMDVRDGVLELTGSSYHQYVNGSPFTMNVSGGRYSDAGTLNCFGGEVAINISGGTFAPTYLLLGNRGGVVGDKPHVLTMTGGTMDVKGRFYAPNNASTYSDCTINLNGGVANVVHIRSSEALYATSVFTANGGTLKPRSGDAAHASDFFSGFDVALLGELGLTFDTPYAITVSQNFTGLVPGACYGTVVKKGEKTLTLSGALCDNVRLVVNEGTLVLDGSVAPTTIAIVQGGVLAVNVSTTLASLTLGDESTHGNLLLGENVELTVTGEVRGSLFHSEFDYVVTTDAFGTHIVRVSHPAEELEIRLDSEGATSNATEAIEFNRNDTLTATVAAHATLNMEGNYGHGRLVKAGAGAAVLTSPDNFFASGVTCSAGRLAANPFSALGLTGVAAPTLTLGNGTVEVTDSAPVTYPGVFNVNAASATAAVIFKNNIDVTLRSVDHTQGALIKRGAGKLTIDPQNRSGSTIVLSRDKGVDAKSNMTHAFDDADGTCPTSGYGGFNVAEGEVELANGKFEFKGNIARIGMPLAAEPAAPVVLTITNSDVKVGGSGSEMFFIANDFQSDAFGQTVRVNVIDSSISSPNSAFCCGGFASDGSSNACVYVGVTNSTVQSGYRLYLSENKNGKVYLNAHKSKFIGGCFSVYAYVESVLDDCLYAAGETGAMNTGGPIVGNVDNGHGWTKFVGGSRAYFSSLGVDGAGEKGVHSVIFDNATWYPSEITKMKWKSSTPINYLLKTDGKGMTVDTPSGGCRNTVRIQGGGGVTKTGAGTFFFDTRSWWSSNLATETKCTKQFGTATWSFTGPVDIQEGVLAVTNGAIEATLSPTVHVASGATWQMLGAVVLTNVVVSGGGTIEGGILFNPTIKGVWTGDDRPGDAPFFAGKVSGTVRVDFGRTEENPLVQPFPTNLLVATCLDDAPVRFRAKGLGNRCLRANFVRVDREVRCTVEASGMMIIVL